MKSFDNQEYNASSNTHTSIPWRISKCLDSEKNQLFYNLVDTNYIVHGYVCSCGQEELILSLNEGIPEYSCHQCGNEVFHDANFAHKFFELFLEKYGVAPKVEDAFDFSYKFEDEYFYDLTDVSLPLEFEYKVTVFDDHIISSYKTSIPIPKEIDFSRKKISSTPIHLYSIVLYNNGTVKEDYCVPYNYTFMQTIKRNLDEYIKVQQCVFGISKPHNESLTYKSLLFFLEHPWLKEYDFYLWDCVAHLPKEPLDMTQALLYMLQGKTHKSLKKAIFVNYALQKKQYGSFQTVFIRTIIGTIKDPNFIVDLLYTEQRFERLSFHDTLFVIDLILFLRGYYSEKQIVSLLLQMQSFDDEMIDILREFYYIRSEVETLFRKTKCSWIAIHDEMVRCAHYKRTKHLMDEKLYYYQEYEKAIAKVLGYDVKLPYNRWELYEWSQKLHNCLSGYFDDIAKGRTIVYGFFIGTELQFAVELQDGKIEQAKGIYNRSLNPVQKEVLDVWYQRFIKKR